MTLLLQTIGACMYSSAYPYSRLCGGKMPGVCFINAKRAYPYSRLYGGLSGLLGSGGRVIYWDL